MYYFSSIQSSSLVHIFCYLFNDEDDPLDYYCDILKGKESPYFMLEESLFRDI